MVVTPFEVCVMCAGAFSLGPYFKADKLSGWRKVAKVPAAVWACTALVTIPVAAVVGKAANLVF